jgi:hypothetical protein
MNPPSIFVTATVVTIVYFIIKFIEMRYVEKESKPLKYLIRDCLVVYLSVICGNFVLEQVNPLISSEGVSVVTPVFTDNPGF